MFKFVSKGDNSDNESALFFNGQKILEVFVAVNTEGAIDIQVEDGNGRLMREWIDFAEDYERLN